MKRSIPAENIVSIGTVWGEKKKKKKDIQYPAFYLIAKASILLSFLDSFSKNNA